MIHETSSNFQPPWGLLHIAELLHRVGNDYTRTVSFASLMASKASTEEARSALNQVANHLQIMAMTHKILRPPSVDEPVDFTDAVARLCRAIGEASQLRHREINLLLTFDRPILLSSWRCWHANLIIAEVINNACRHAFGSRSGRIAIKISESHGRVICVVGDDGRGTKMPPPSLGTQLVDALAAELNGLVLRRFTQSGSTVTLSFLKDDPGVSTRPMHARLAGSFRMKSESRDRTRMKGQGAIHPRPVAAKHHRSISDWLNPARTES
jgi:two-component sensor histidine kinase